MPDLFAWPAELLLTPTAADADAGACADEPGCQEVPPPDVTQQPGGVGQAAAVQQAGLVLELSNTQLQGDGCAGRDCCGKGSVL